MLQRTNGARGLARRLCMITIVGVGLLTPGAVEAAPAEKEITKFPSVRQWYSLSCEYAAAAAVTLYWGDVVSQRDFVREVPLSPNPHAGFRGDIDGPWGGINDYGVYAEPLVPVLERRGYDAQVYYGNLERLRSTLRAGIPVVVWLTSGQAARPEYTRTYQGQTFTLVPGEHAVVAYAFDSTGIDLMDVGNGGFYHTGWSSFLRRWGYFDQMMLVITPAKN
ncbi:MAG TPA: C39 family peptidase [Chloroflexia bacterium]|nr:C39 family peptidase [Chloroflexia bacterium]